MGVAGLIILSAPRPFFVRRFSNHPTPSFIRKSSNHPTPSFIRRDLNLNPDPSPIIGEGLNQGIAETDDPSTILVSRDTA